MAKGNALGFIESVGLASAIAAADAALKAANVELIGRENSRGYGYITIKIAGEVGAVQAAIAAAKASSVKVARVWSVDVIPRPAKDLGEVLVWNADTQGATEWRAARGAGEGAALPALREDVSLAKPPTAEIAAVSEGKENIPAPKPAAGGEKKPTARKRPNGRGKKAK